MVSSAGWEKPGQKPEFEDERLELIKAGAGYAVLVCKNDGLVCKEDFTHIDSGIPDLREIK